MKPEALLEPLSDDAPCGPDLNAAMDPEYDAYYFGALGRLPGFFVQPGVERPDGTRTSDRYFDVNSVDLQAETTAIDALLARTRDIRLLVLRAQWQALTGRLKPMAETIEAITLLLETCGDAVHPTVANGPSERRDALADLNQPIMIVQPLQFMNLTGAGDVSLRKIRVANGTGTPLQAEQDLNLSALTAMISDNANRKRVDESHSALLTIADCLVRIDKTCQSNAIAPFSVNLAEVKQTVSEMIDLITSARPDLNGLPEPVEDTDGQTDAEDPPGETDATGASQVVAETATTEVVSHAHARMVLEACEHYYRQSEPSSAALLLTTQARLLIGKPLVEALETLLPAQAAQAVVDFGPKTGFSLNIERLRALTNAAPESPQPNPVSEPQHPLAVPEVRNGSDAAAALRSVEDYFRAAEKSSPVPLLLQRARSYQGRDFQALVDELIPQPPTS